MAYLEEPNSKLFGGDSTLEVAPKVFLIVLDNAGNQIRGRHAVCALCGIETAAILNKRVYIIVVHGLVGDIIVCNIINLGSCKERIERGPCISIA